ncbi:MAG: histidinol-phosphate transaminase [Flavobacteriaceae bacterium]|nr:histidinol-phosphate transaminase [Flavobacteriaceae bacterium]
MKIQDLVRDNIKNLKAYSSARNEFKSSINSTVFLDANENPYGNGVNRYPDPNQQRLKAVLASHKNVSPDNILLGNGSDEVLDLILRAFCNPGIDNIITLPPTYGMYEVLANVNAVDVIKVNLNTDFQPDVDGILSARNQNSKILFLCSPNNPSGNSFGIEDVEKLLIEFKGIVIIDEAYIDFAEQDSWLLRLEEFPGLIITQTLSKAYGMAGIRLGICYASQDIISILEKIKPPYNINALTQEKAIDRLSQLEEIQTEIKTIVSDKLQLIKDLLTIDFVEHIFPSDSNFLLFRVDDASKRYNQLIKSGIVVRNRSKQTLCHNCLRVTIGTFIENKKLVTTLKTLE